MCEHMAPVLPEAFHYVDPPLRAQDGLYGRNFRYLQGMVRTLGDIRYS